MHPPDPWIRPSQAGQTLPKSVRNTPASHQQQTAPTAFVPPSGTPFNYLLGEVSESEKRRNRGRTGPGAHPNCAEVTSAPGCCAGNCFPNAIKSQGRQSGHPLQSTVQAVAPSMLRPTLFPSLRQWRALTATSYSRRIPDKLCRALLPSSRQFPLPRRIVDHRAQAPRAPPRIAPPAPPHPRHIPRNHTATRPVDKPRSPGLC
jgi:hypothetical protein